jgi:putative isomerase
MQLNLLVRDQLHGGQLLAFSGLDGPTDFSDGLIARTAVDSPAIDIKLPGAGRIKFAPITKVFLGGDFFEIKTAEGEVRGAFLDAHHLLVEGPCKVGECGPEIRTHTTGERCLLGSTKSFDPSLIQADLEAALTARKHWLKALPVPDGLPPLTAQTLAKALSQMKTQVYAPEGRMRRRFTTPDRWPHRGMWLWDSVFHAIGWRHIHPALAREMIDAVLDVQGADGFISHANAPQRSSEVTQPPLLALGVKLVNDIDPQPAWIEQVYPKLCAYIEWDFAHRDSDGLGLVEWAIDADPNCRSGESGMDNSSRFDRANRLDAVDFNAYLSLECQILSEFAHDLGRPAEAQDWQARHVELNRLINARLWSEKEKFYLDYDLDRNQPSPVLASVGFMPLICGAASADQARALADHLANPAMFGTPFRIASIAVKDTLNYQKDMWRGPVWININWLIAYGFEKAGLPEIAGSLRAETMKEIEQTCARFGTLFEYFDDRREIDPPSLLRKGSCAPEASPYHQVIHDYGWTATLYVDLVFSIRE